MACPLPKQQRSNYIHLDSIEPTTWDCIAALYKSIVGTVTVSGPVEVDDSTPIDVAISGQPIQTIPYPGSISPVAYGDSASIDAFARLRVSNPSTLFDSQLQYDLSRIHWENAITDVSGNADITHNANGAEAELYVEAKDSAIRQTRRYFRYQPGKSQMILITFVLDEVDAELTQRVGYFDGQNGIFLETDGTTINIVRRSNTTGTPDDVQVAKNDWNIDNFDGNGPSGYLLDLTKSQIFFIDLEWLGVGRVRCGFVIDGIPYYAHQFLHANIVTGVYMTTANLPIRYEISATASLVGGKTLRAICSSVISEGGFEIGHGLEFSVSNEVTLRPVTNAGYLPLLAIRPKLTFNSIVNRGRILLEGFTLYSASVTVHYDLYWGATLTGGAWVSAGADSITEYNITATALSGGIQIMSGYVPSSVQTRGAAEHDITADYPLFLDIAGSHPTTPYTDSLVIAAKSLGNSTDCGSSLEFRELR